MHQISTAIDFYANVAKNVKMMLKVMIPRINETEAYIRSC